MAGVVAAGETYTYPQDMGSDEGRAAWMLAEPWAVLVAEEEGRVLGTAKFGPNWPGRGSHVATRLRRRSRGGGPWGGQGPG